MAQAAPAAPIEGVCDTRFRALKDAFAANFAERGETGANIALMIGGEIVVDLWGGWSDAARTRPWERDTLVNFFSVGKALTAICALLGVERGLIDLDAPIARQWPSFAAADKAEITLRHVLSHRAGLPAVRAPLADGTQLDWGAMTSALEAQPPWWTPGAAHGYHVNTYGYLVGEVVRRAMGVSLGAVLRTEIAGPLGADVYIGLPAREHRRVAEFIYPTREAPSGPGASGIGAPQTGAPQTGAPQTGVSRSGIDASGTGQSAAREGAERSSEVALMRANAYANPPGVSGAGWVNTPAWRSAEIPSTNGHGAARGVAQIYAALPFLLSPDMLAAATQEHSCGEDLILGRPSRFGLGFQLTQSERPIGPNARAFGHFGAGGSLGYYDPDAELAFSYLGNHMGPRWQNPLNRALLEAIYARL